MNYRLSVLWTQYFTKKYEFSSHGMKFPCSYLQQRCYHYCKHRITTYVSHKCPKFSHCIFTWRSAIKLQFITPEEVLRLSQSYATNYSGYRKYSEYLYLFVEVHTDVTSVFFTIKVEKDIVFVCWIFLTWILIGFSLV